METTPVMTTPPTPNATNAYPHSGMVSPLLGDPPELILTEPELESFGVVVVTAVEGKGLWVVRDGGGLGGRVMVGGAEGGVH